MQQAIELLIDLGPLPAENTLIDDALVTTYEQLLSTITTPVSNDEAVVLTTLFGVDSCYGLAWTLIHLIESAPHWPIQECLINKENTWISILHERATRHAQL